MLTNWLLSLGLTRDSAMWFWSRLTSFALLVLSGAVDLSPYLSPAHVRSITFVCAIVLWFSGKYDSSPLPGRKL
jgi:hypothetical protein